MLDGGLLAEQRGETRDLHAQSSANVLGVVAGEIANAGIRRAKIMSWSTSLAKAWDLTGACCSHLGLVVLSR